MSFKFKHWYRECLMSVIGKIRRRVRPGSNLDLDLAEKYSALLDAQMADRKKAGVIEIQCFVIWGLEEDTE